MSIPFTTLLPGLIKAAAQVGSYFISRGDIARQNKYNSPAEQVKRLREAGLPYGAAADFSNEQKNLPDSSGIAEAGVSLGDYYKTATTINKMELLKEQINNIVGKNKILGNEIQISDAEATWLLDHGVNLRGQYFNNRQYQMQLELEMNESQKEIKAHEAELKAIEEAIKTATQPAVISKAWADLSAVLAGTRLKNQLFDNIEKEKEARNFIIDSMTEGGLNIGEALLLMVMQSFTGSFSKGGFQIGN